MKKEYHIKTQQQPLSLFSPLVFTLLLASLSLSSRILKVSLYYFNLLLSSVSSLLIFLSLCSLSSLSCFSYLLICKLNKTRITSLIWVFLLAQSFKHLFYFAPQANSHFPLIPCFADLTLPLAFSFCSVASLFMKFHSVLLVEIFPILQTPTQIF